MTKMKDVFNKDYLDGVEAGLDIAKQIALKEGFEIKFPDDFREMEIKRS